MSAAIKAAVAARCVRCIFPLLTIGLRPSHGRPC
jgi:hypothetical protein